MRGQKKFNVNWIFFFFAAINAKAIGSPHIADGARFAMAVAYQSCDVLKFDPMSEDSEEVSGIKIVGKHPNGVGDQFVISDLKSVLNTHYYWKNLDRPSSDSCRDLRQKPLIYDYGGKPSISSTDAKYLNFFKDAGSGTAELGIDCSGFVFSAMASVGARFSANQKISGKLVNSYNAYSFKEISKSGLTCFNEVSYANRQPLQAGDIIASSYHVVIVDWSDSDPFGIDKIRRMQDCNSIKAGDFKFTFIHSAPFKNGVGINRVRGGDYIQDNFWFSIGMLSYAKSVCKNRFDPESHDSDLIEGIIGPTVKIIRHKDTPECRDKPVRLEGQQCVERCNPYEQDILEN